MTRTRKRKPNKDFVSLASAVDVHDAADATTMLMIPNVCQNAADDEDDDDDDDDGDDDDDDVDDDDEDDDAATDAEPPSCYFPHLPSSLHSFRSFFPSFRSPPWHPSSRQ